MRRRLKPVRQHDSMQCGAACLATIMKWYGRDVRLTEIEEYCTASKDGVSMLTLKNTAERYGFDTAVVRLSVDALAEMPEPMILFWNQNHYVVLAEVSDNKYRIADPGRGTYTCDRDEFEEHWIGFKSNHNDRKGICMLLEPNENFKKSDSGRRTTVRDALSFIFGYLKSYRKYFFQISVGLGIGCLLQLALPFLTQAIVDKGIKNSDISIVWLILVGEIVIVIAQTITDFIRRWLVLHISMRIKISLVSDFLIKLLKLPMSFFERKKIGDIVQRINDHDRIQNFLTGQCLSFVFTILTLLVFGSVLVYYNLPVSIVFLIGSAVYLIWISVFLKRRKIIDYDMFGTFSVNQSRTYEMVSSIQEIKLQDCEVRQRWRLEDVQAELFEIQMQSLKLQQAQEAGSVLINQLKNLLITVMTASAVIDGSMTLGAMMAVQYIIGQLNSPIDQMMSFVYSMQDVKMSLERINEIHNGEDEEDRTKKYVKTDNDSYPIAFENVYFSYEKGTPNHTIDGVSFVIPKGKVTAIVGESGSGKTTLLKLMLGYYGTDSGRVLIDGSPIGDYSPKWWRQQCGVVMQGGVIFSETIARNIAVSDGEIDNERLVFAAQTANILQYIKMLPMGFDTIIGNEGAGLSEGQKQRLLIARAIYRDPKVVIFDEATNSLDAMNEKVIVENMNDFYRGRTVVVVAHRLSTVKSADNIIVLEKGRIVEEGSHDELLKQKGSYYNLVRNQLELGG